MWDSFSESRSPAIVEDPDEAGIDWDDRDDGRRADADTRPRREHDD